MENARRERISRLIGLVGGFSLAIALGNISRIYGNDEKTCDPIVISREPAQTQPARKYANEYSISQRGIDTIKEFEGYSPNVCRDAAGKQIIGYGHLIRKGESYSSLAGEQAEEILRKDLNSAERAVRNMVKVKLNQGQYDALVSFTYNLGAGSLQKSTLLRELNNGNYDTSGNEFLKWNKAGGKILKGLVNRREKERKLFSSED